MKRAVLMLALLAALPLTVCAVEPAQAATGVREDFARCLGARASRPHAAPCRPPARPLRWARDRDPRRPNRAGRPRSQRTQNNGAHPAATNISSCPYTITA